MEHVNQANTNSDKEKVNILTASVITVFAWYVGRSDMVAHCQKKEIPLNTKSRWSDEIFQLHQNILKIYMTMGDDPTYTLNLIKQSIQKTADQIKNSFLFGKGSRIASVLENLISTDRLNLIQPIINVPKTNIKLFDTNKFTSVVMIKIELLAIIWEKLMAYRTKREGNFIKFWKSWEKTQPNKKNAFLKIEEQLKTYQTLNKPTEIDNAIIANDVLKIFRDALTEFSPDKKFTLDNKPTIQSNLFSDIHPLFLTDTFGEMLKEVETYLGQFTQPVIKLPFNHSLTS